MTGTSQSTVTKDFVQYELQETRVVLRDTYGWESYSGSSSGGSTYSLEDFNRFLKGIVPDKHNMSTPTSKYDVADPRRRIDAVIFFLPATLDEVELKAMWNGQSNSSLPGLSAFYKEALDKGIKVLLAVSQLDKAKPFVDRINRLRVSYDTIITSTEWQDMRDKFGERLNLPPDHYDFLLPLISYTATDGLPQRSKYLEEFALHAIDAATSRSSLVRPVPPLRPWTIADTFANEAAVVIPNRP